MKINEVNSRLLEQDKLNQMTMLKNLVMLHFYYPETAVNALPHPTALKRTNNYSAKHAHTEINGLDACYLKYLNVCTTL
uniref:Uncharacterized protein n=1 Tax=Trichobilharzia regenti TaxID=157069 RepID=A0AA85IXG2_TRIRE|nr:unnamed protein product [Trichobilharzia regenti]